MAKDPAVLWYWNDWHSGTILLSRFLKGCYMDLLHAQFNHGKLSLEDIKTCLGSDFGSAWPALQKKFKEEKGFYFNERMEDEKTKRKQHSKKQSENAQKRWNQKSGNATAYAKPMPLEDGNEIENEKRHKEFLKNNLRKEEFCMAKGLKMEDLDKIQQRFLFDIAGKEIRDLWAYFTKVYDEGKYYGMIKKMVL